jgi:hypothetical protein
MPIPSIEGAMMSWRLGLRVPCFHVISAQEGPEHCATERTNPCNVGNQNIEIREFSGDWTVAQFQTNAHGPTRLDELEIRILKLDCAEEERTVPRILREVPVNGLSCFEYSRDGKVLQFGRIHDQPRNKLGSLANVQLKPRTDSLFLLECVHMAKVNGAWL